MTEGSSTLDTAQRSPVRTLVVHGSFVLLSVALLLLGLWQLDRADEKRTMLAQEALSADAPAVELEAVLDNIEQAATAYTRVRLSGTWLPDRQLLWDNRIASGSAGYEVLTPFQTDSGSIVLVNRGWVPVGTTRSVLPDVARGVVDGQSWAFEGVVTRPSKGLASGPAIEPVGGSSGAAVSAAASEAASASGKGEPSVQRAVDWPRRAQYLDYKAFSEAMQLDLVPALIQARLKDAPVEVAWHHAGNWEPTESIGPSRHLGYAVQWFGLLATLIFLYFWYEIRLFRGADKGQDT